MQVPRSTSAYDGSALKVWMQLIQQVWSLLYEHKFQNGASLVNEQILTLARTREA